jgi:hypothetical protein
MFVLYFEFSIDHLSYDRVKYRTKNRLSLIPFLYTVIGMLFIALNQRYWKKIDLKVI